MKIVVPDTSMDKPEGDYTLEDAEAEFEENWYDYKDDVKVKNKADKIQKRLCYTYFAKYYDFRKY